MIDLFVGGAGTGKTFQLMSATEQIATGIDWRPHQSILGLTFMHGSRRRLDSRLRPVRKLGHRAVAETLDSFCLRLVRMYRRHLGLSGTLSARPGDMSQDWRKTDDGASAGFEVIRRSAEDLLRRPYVACCVAAAHPLLLLDEVQDCTGTLLAFTKALTAAVPRVIAAGDEFQLLTHESEGCPAIEWLRGNATVVELTDIHRTDSRNLIEGAARLRSGDPKGNSILVKAVPPGLAAWEIASRLAWKGWNDSCAILAPVTPGRSKYVRDVLSSLGRELGRTQKIGPYNCPWERSDEERVEDLLAAAWQPFAETRSCTVDALADLAERTDGPRREIYRRLRRRMRLQGVLSIEPTVFRELVVRFHHAGRAGRGGRDERRTAMSVHSAKNREFEHVAVLWPYEVTGSSKYRRRLLYNAITRAKRDANVLVQGKDSRLKDDGALRLLCSPSHRTATDNGLDAVPLRVLPRE